MLYVLKTLPWFGNPAYSQTRLCLEVQEDRVAVQDVHVVEVGLEAQPGRAQRQRQLHGLWGLRGRGDDREKEAAAAGVGGHRVGHHLH